jgi:hypothetical protein
MYKENNKKAIMKWRDANKEQYNAYLNKYKKEHYREKANNYRMKSYYVKREFEIFRKILL